MHLDKSMTVEFCPTCEARLSRLVPELLATLEMIVNSVGPLTAVQLEKGLETPRANEVSRSYYAAFKAIAEAEGTP